MNTTQFVKKTSRYLLRELKYGISGKPYFLNYPTATLCNHKCVMCNIHEIKTRDEISISGLDKIVSDPLFSNIESIGLSGGEPFMKKDLVEVVKTLVDNLGSLHHFSINSNGQLPNRIKEWLPEIKDYCNKKGVEFNMVLSMDGVGDVHNQVRGRDNAWKHLEETFRHVKNIGLKPSILMTIHRKNYHDVFNVLAYSLNNNIAPYFGIATIIERLGNEFKHDQFSISKMDKYYIWEFYQNLSNDKNFGINKQIWYKMLSYQLLYTQQRKASCVAKNKGVYLSDSGQISYCGVYDKELKTYGEESLYKRFLDKRNDQEIRQKMIDKHCNTCMHDYQSKPTAKDIYEFIKIKYSIPQIKRVVEGTVYNIIKKRAKRTLKTKSINSILLYGWFGTETIGDKAIYAEIIRFFSAYFPGVKFIIASNMIAYTERTLLELNLGNIEIVKVSKAKKTIEKYDLLAYCGGPIMGYSDLYDHYHLVNSANKFGKYTMIYGAGYSPISNKNYAKIASKMIVENDIVVFRDIQSVEKLKNDKKYDVKQVVTSVIDPAYIWVLNQKITWDKPQRPTLGLSFRVFPNDQVFGGNKSDEFSKKIQIYIRVANEFIEEQDGHVVLVPMNTYHIGGDDRKALYLINQGIEKKDRVTFMSGFFSPIETLEHFAMCDYFIGMRFHSSVFANALGIPTVGIEYVLPRGKVTNLFNKLDRMDSLINIKNLNYQILKEKVNFIITNHDKIKKGLAEKNKELKKEYLENIMGVLKEVIGQ